MKLLVDPNLSQRWIEWLRDSGFEPEHWSTVGDVKGERLRNHGVRGHAWLRGSDVGSGLFFDSCGIARSKPERGANPG